MKKKITHTISSTILYNTKLPPPARSDSLSVNLNKYFFHVTRRSIASLRLAKKNNAPSHDQALSPL